MKAIVRRVMLSAAFVVGLAVPLAETWTTPAQAFANCSLLSGQDSWSHTIPGAGSFTVTVHYSNGVTLTGTPPPFTSLPLVLTSASGKRLTISDAGGGEREYEGSFSATASSNCTCPNAVCDSDHDCTVPSPGGMCIGQGSCTSTSCSGGISTWFSARF